MTRLAIFDLDHTLIATDSDHAFTRFLIEQGYLDAAEAEARNERFYQDYCNGCLNIHEYVAFQIRALHGVLPAERARLHERFMREKIVPHLREKARETVERHRRNGDELLVISSTNEFIITPICAAFGIGQVIGTALVCDEHGCLTGEIDGVPSLGEGKILRLQHWLQARGQSRADYETLYFYSDSKNDLPLLRHADVAVAVNPDDTLRQVAQAEGWQIEDWD